MPHKMLKVAVGLTILKNQIQASGAERHKFVPRMHQKSPFADRNSKKFSGEGDTPPHTSSPSAPSAPRSSRLRRLNSAPTAPRP